ncbi:C-type lectin mannose-binding isoform-like [Rhagoletis pomonella]|uniref:C-type lectin mannose-binding isoform-like n=1 Tax=Rhagoletis pomonella TaxID=28610 RepID=UPI00177FE611|nr:C-type lectin mannose-binding isoform-like [Rhagoletis pomonella]
MKPISIIALSIVSLAALWQCSLAAVMAEGVISTGDPYLQINPSAGKRSEAVVATAAAMPLNQRFYLGTEKLSWYEANYYCGLGNLKLVQLTNPSLEAELKGFLSYYGLESKHYWTGGNRFNTQHNWSWGLTSYTISYSHWASQQPSNYTTEKHCLKLWGKTNEWLSEDCDIAYDFICQKY